MIKLNESMKIVLTQGEDNRNDNPLNYYCCDGHLILI